MLFISYPLIQLSDVLNSEKIVQHLANNNGEHSKSCRLLLQKWSTLKEAVYLLRIPFNATIEFQSQRLTLSDVYNRWTIMQLHLNECTLKKAYKSGLAKNLLAELKAKNKIIFQNPLMACALYLDPRFQLVITQDSDKTEIAKQNLIRIGRKINYLRSQVSIADTSNSNKSTDSLSFEFDEQSAMSEHLYQGLSQQNAATTQNIHQLDIEMIVDTFQPEPMPPSTSVLQYWESIKNENHELYGIAMVVFSVPPTEVQIERDFSSLGFVFSDRRTRLNQDRLEDIMLIFLNKELYEIVSQNDLKTALEKNHIRAQ